MMEKAEVRRLTLSFRYYVQPDTRRCWLTSCHRFGSRPFVCVSEGCVFVSPCYVLRSLF